MNVIYQSFSLSSSVGQCIHLEYHDHNRFSCFDWHKNNEIYEDGTEKKTNTQTITSNLWFACYNRIYYCRAWMNSVTMHYCMCYIFTCIVHRAKFNLAWHSWPKCIPDTWHTLKIDFFLGGLVKMLKGKVAIVSIYVYFLFGPIDLQLFLILLYLWFLFTSITMLVAFILFFVFRWIIMQWSKCLWKLNTAKN